MSLDEHFDVARIQAGPQPTAQELRGGDVLPEPARVMWPNEDHPANTGGPSLRVPHSGHTIIFVAFAFFALLLTQLLLLPPHTLPAGATVTLQPKRQLATMAIAYVATVGFCFLTFPLFWGRGFLAGVQWNGDRARQLWTKLVPFGLLLGWTVQAISSLIPMPKTIPMDDFFKVPSDVWLVTVFGTLVAPVFEELAFRGFLLPAVTIAFDWLGPVLRYVVEFSRCRLRGDVPPEYVVAFGEPRDAGLNEGADNLTARSRAAIVLASLVTSALFAMLHADQLADALPALGVLFCVSLALTIVRVRTRSVACSAMVHGCYNLSVFLSLFFATGGYRHLDKITR